MITHRLDSSVLAEMAELLDEEKCNEMAIPSYRHSNPLLRWMAWRRVEILARQLVACSQTLKPKRPDTALMDFGCGTGVLFGTEHEHFGQVYGVDVVLDAARLLVAKRSYKNVHLLCPERARKEITDHSLDVIVAGEVLEHISPLDDTLHFFREKIRHNGKLLVTVPTENTVYRFGRWLAGFRKHFHVSNAASINEKILRCGFRNANITRIPLSRPFDIYWLITYDPL